MIDKVQKIREEVERLMYGYNLEADIASCEDAETEKLADIKYQLCKKILDYIDSLQEEPVSNSDWLTELQEKLDNATPEQLKELWNKYNGVDEEEPVTEDWEESYRNWVLSHNDGDKLYCKNAWRAAMDWQKQLDKIPVSEDLEEASKNYALNNTPWDDCKDEIQEAFKAGANWKDKQMMEKAIDAHVNYAWSGLSFGGFNWSKTGLGIGDKCKLIIIKEG